MWTPFNTRFGQLLERMARHEELFRQEARLMEGKMVDKLQRSVDFHYRRLHDVLSKAWVKKDEATESEVSKTRKKHIGNVPPGHDFFSFRICAFEDFLVMHLLIRERRASYSINQGLDWPDRVREHPPACQTAPAKWVLSVVPVSRAIHHMARQSIR